MKNLVCCFALTALAVVCAFGDEVTVIGSTDGKERRPMKVQVTNASKVTGKRISQLALKRKNMTAEEVAALRKKSMETFENKATQRMFFYNSNLVSITRSVNGVTLRYLDGTSREIPVLDPTKVVDVSKLRKGSKAK